MNSNKNKRLFFSPDICEIPKGCTKRLIDSGLLHYEASVAGYNERYHRGQTSHTIHVWWARRPHSAMRALLFASLSKNTSQEAINVMASLAMGTEETTISKARDMIHLGYEPSPKILDMFGGGGTIPFEAMLLGADTYSIDSNQLSVFIQKCNIQYAKQVDLEEAKAIIESSGTNILNRLKAETDWLYPLRGKNGEKTFGYMWSYKTTCAHCGKSFYLIKRPWLTTKKGKRLSFMVIREDEGEKLEIRQLAANESFSSTWEKGSGKCFCPYCNELQEKIDISKCEDALLAIINAEKDGKAFYCAPQNALPPVAHISQEENRILEELKIELPNSKLPVWSGVVNPALYGIHTHSDFLNKRQRLLLLYLIKELLYEYKEIESSNKIMAKFVIGILSSLIDQVVDWNCRMSMWIPMNEQVGRAFCGPGVAMLWDYAETDMLLHGPANLWDKLKRIVSGVSSFKYLDSSDSSITIKHAHAQDIPFDDNMFDAIVTDPPYYDNIYYSILADFFFAWKRIVLQAIEPNLFRNQITETKYELVASSRREGKGNNPHESYCIELKRAFEEAARVIKSDGIFSFVYSHSSVNGWDAIIQSYRSSPFWITSVQPLSIERKGRPRAVLSEAINTCMAFVARKSNDKRHPITIGELLKKVEAISCTFGQQLVEQSGWGSSDAGLAVLAYAVGLIANSECVIGADSDYDALLTIGKEIKKAYPEFTLKTRNTI